jgi:hypothetical protein
MMKEIVLIGDRPRLLKMSTNCLLASFANRPFGVVISPRIDDVIE